MASEWEVVGKKPSSSRADASPKGGSDWEVASKAPASQEPSMLPLDEMSMRYGEPDTVQKATMPYQKQMGRVGQVFRGAARGAIAGVPGLPGDIESLGRAGVNFFSPEFFEQETFLPTTQELAAKMPGAPSPDSPRYKAEQIGVTGGGMLAPIGTAGKAAAILARPSKFERLLTEITARGGKIGEEAKLRAGETLEEAQTRLAADLAKAEGERIKRETAVGKLERRTEKQPVEVVEMQTSARTEAGLPAPETSTVIAAQQDVNSQLRNLGQQALTAAEKEQAKVGGGAFEKYKQVAETKQKAIPFGASPQGQQLKTELEKIIAGGAGRLKEYSEAEIAIARKIRNELFGKPADEIGEAEITALAAMNPNRSMSEAAKRAQAKQTLMQAEGSAQKPVDFKIVDDLLRELRQTQASKAPEAATAIARQRYKSAADMIEDALKGYVGEANYPRDIYAKSSEAFNKFRTKLGEALTAVEEIPYAEKGGVSTTRQSRLAPLVFESRENVKFAKELIGPDNVNKLGVQHAINELAGKDAAAIEKWLNNPANEFIYEIPGLHEKLVKYGQSLARREGDNKAMEALQKQLQKGREQVRKVAETEKAAATKQSEVATKTYQQTVADIDKFARTLSVEDPAKLSSKFQDIRPSLEKTGVFNAAELDALERDIARLSKIASDAERRRDIGVLAGKIIKKVLTLGMGR